MTDKHKSKTISVIRGFSKKKGETLDIRLRHHLQSLGGDL